MALYARKFTTRRHDRGATLTILGFYSDNGGEYVNGRVAKLLEKLLIEQTKSRARRSNDNALVKGKNGSGNPQELWLQPYPEDVPRAHHRLCREFLMPYLNFHRPCFFPTTEVGAKGEAVKHNRYADMMTPYEKLKFLPNEDLFLKLGVTFAQLDEDSTSMTDNVPLFIIPESAFYVDVLKLFSRYASSRW